VLDEAVQLRAQQAPSLTLVTPSSHDLDSPSRALGIPPIGSPRRAFSIPPISTQERQSVDQDQRRAATIDPMPTLRPTSRSRPPSRTSEDLFLDNSISDQHFSMIDESSFTDVPKAPVAAPSMLPDDPDDPIEHADPLHSKNKQSSSTSNEPTHEGNESDIGEYKRPAKKGRRPKDITTAMDSICEKANAMFQGAAQKLGMDADTLIAHFNKTDGRGPNIWNTYQRYFVEHRDEEIGRLPRNVQARIKGSSEPMSSE
jgi:hypothetical protein